MWFDRLLQGVREKGDWESWISYMIQGVENTAKESIQLIEELKVLMAEMKNTLRDNYKFYSQELLNNIFAHPYTKIEFLVRDLGVSRITAANYLNQLAADGVLLGLRYYGSPGAGLAPVWREDWPATAEALPDLVRSGLSHSVTALRENARRRYPAR